MGTAIRYSGLDWKAFRQTCEEATKTITLADYVAEDFPRADYRAYLEETTEADRDIVWFKVNPDGEVILVIDYETSYIFTADDARNTTVYLRSKDDPNAPDGWYDEPEDEDDPYSPFDATTERSIEAEAEADRRCAQMLRKGIVDFMAMAEEFQLIEEGVRRATARHEKNTLPYHARIIRLRMLCELGEGESWREAKLRYEAVLQ
jgi:hypothetical protein